MRKWHNGIAGSNGAANETVKWIDNSTEPIGVITWIMKGTGRISSFFFTFLNRVYRASEA